MFPRCLPGRRSRSILYFISDNSHDDSAVYCCAILDIRVLQVSSGRFMRVTPSLTSFSNRDRLNPTGHYSPWTHVTAGGIAGAVAAAVTTPLDVCKTLLQTRGSSDDAAIRKARGMADAARIIWERQGAAGFARGMTPRILTNMPSNALCCERPQFHIYVRVRVLISTVTGLSYEGFRFLLKGKPTGTTREGL